MKQVIENILTYNKLDLYIGYNDIKVIREKGIYNETPFILLEGYADIIYKESKDKKILHRLHPSDNHLCNISKFLGQPIKNTSFKLSKDSLIGVVDKGVIENLSTKNSFLKITYFNLSEFTFNKIKDEKLARELNGEEKISKFLLRYSRDNRYIVDNYTDLSKILNVNRNYLYKVIWKLEDQNLIEKNKNILTILDRDQLSKTFF